jgi:hypothetical protein
MKQVLVCCAMAAICTTGIGARQNPAAPKPGPEQKNLARFAGSWKIEATAEPSPFGPGGKVTGTQKCTMFEGGWHLVCDSSGTSPTGTMTGHAVMSYDRSAKEYRYFAINSGMPEALISTGVLSGSTWTWTGKSDMGGQTLHSRFTLVEKSPTVHSIKYEMSMDGTSWATMMTGTSTKTGS